MPVGAYGGRKDLMEQVSPLGGVYQAGTLSGNPIAMAAGIAQMTYLRKSSGSIFALGNHGRTTVQRSKGAYCEV